MPVLMVNNTNSQLYWPCPRTVDIYSHGHARARSLTLLRDSTVRTMRMRTVNITNSLLTDRACARSITPCFTRYGHRSLWLAPITSAMLCYAMILLATTDVGKTCPTIPKVFFSSHLFRILHQNTHIYIHLMRPEVHFYFVLHQR